MSVCATGVSGGLLLWMKGWCVVVSSWLIAAGISSPYLGEGKEVFFFSHSLSQMGVLLVLWFGYEFVQVIDLLIRLLVY